MTHLDLFSGIGGFALAARRTGIKTQYFSETCPKANKVLTKNFPDIPNLGDIKKLDGNWIRDFIGIDIITGGFPCVDLSLASKGSHKGLDGKESGLFYEMARVVIEVYPKWVIIENVPKLLKHLTEIENEMHFHCWGSTIIEPFQYGTPCRRKRAFFVGCSQPGGAAAVLDFAEKRKQVVQGGGSQDVLPMCLPWKGGVSLERLASCIVEDTEVDPTRIREGAGISRGMDGPRYLMLGNSLAPAIPEILFRGIIEYEGRNE